MFQPLLSISNLKTHFFTRKGIIKAVDGISFDVAEGEFVGLVGESGSGKSVTALSVMKLVPNPPGRIVDGMILFRGQNLIDFDQSKMRKIRGKEIAVCFQDPLTYLNPVHKVGDQITEAILLHENINKEGAHEKAIKIMEKVRIDDAARRVAQYPHQMSGGMRQRCLLAIALACNPSLLIADEPTTSVDVITQDSILHLLNDIKRESGLAVLLITHNLGIVAGYTQRTIIMYAGDILEIGSVRMIFKRPYHPYTRGLLRAIPRLDETSDRLISIRGSIADPINPPLGCKFHPRCDSVREICKRTKPELKEVEPNHFVACHIYG